MFHEFKVQSQKCNIPVFVITIEKLFPRLFVPGKAVIYFYCVFPQFHSHGEEWESNTPYWTHL